MSLTLTLLMLARQVAAAPVPPPRDGAAELDDGVLVEVVTADRRQDRAWCAAQVDAATDELVIRASPQAWDRVQAAFDAPAPGDMVRIVVPRGGSARELAGLVRASHPHLLVVDDDRTRTILVSGLPDLG